MFCRWERAEVNGQTGSSWLKGYGNSDNHFHCENQKTISEHTSQTRRQKTHIGFGPCQPRTRLGGSVDTKLDSWKIGKKHNWYVHSKLWQKQVYMDEKSMSLRFTGRYGCPLFHTEIFQLWKVSWGVSCMYNPLSISTGFRTGLGLGHFRVELLSSMSLFLISYFSFNVGFTFFSSTL